MVDFLIFEKFITQNVLIFFYYIGAVFMPLFIYIFHDKVQELLHVKSITNNKKVIILIVVFILFAELFWRMMFEAMIGYFDMHDYLQQLVKSKG